MAEHYPEEWEGAPACLKSSDARVFDLFSMWRMDSGGYEEMVSSWVEIGSLFRGDMDLFMTQDTPGSPCILSSLLSA
jgi:hypothetical protein